jgi:Mg-chelatase subunit ChlI
MEVRVTRNAPSFPFSAIVGQETLKTALLVNAVDPRVGGVLVRGEKGTAKSTAVRALAAVLPPIEVVADCRFSCDPDDAGHLCDECRVRAAEGDLPRAIRRPRVVELPVSATEDRLVGTLDMEHALKHGERRFEAGLMAAANRGILYVDEVNLLDDHLVDTLLDAAAMGVNTVEREGVAYSHPARFILVGTMNPEEGDVRPQLLDRFGLCVDVQGLSIPDQRVAVVERRSLFEDERESFLAEWAAEESELEAVLLRARATVGEMRMPRPLVFLIANACAEMGVDGHRADLTMARAATALAALEGRRVPDVDDIRTVAPLVLAHRMRRRPFEDVSFDQMRIDALLPAGADDGSEGSSQREEGGREGDGGRPSDDRCRRHRGEPGRPPCDAAGRIAPRGERTTSGDALGRQARTVQSRGDAASGKGTGYSGGRDDPTGGESRPLQGGRLGGQRDAGGHPVEGAQAAGRDVDRLLCGCQWVDGCIEPHGGGEGRGPGPARGRVQEAGSRRCGLVPRERGGGPADADLEC